jgi:hypothetical protein
MVLGRNPGPRSSALSVDTAPRRNVAGQDRLPVRRQCARCRPRPHRAHMGRAHRARARAAYDRRGRVAVRHEKHEYLTRETRGRVYTFGCLTTSR